LYGGYAICLSANKKLSARPCFYSGLFQLGPQPGLAGRDLACRRPRMYLALHVGGLRQCRVGAQLRSFSTNGKKITKTGFPLKRIQTPTE